MNQAADTTKKLEILTLKSLHTEGDKNKNNNKGLTTATTIDTGRAKRLAVVAMVSSNKNIHADSRLIYA